MRNGASSSSGMVFVVAITELSHELVLDHSAADAKLHRIVPTSGRHLPERRRRAFGPPCGRGRRASLRRGHARRRAYLVSAGRLYQCQTSATGGRL